MVNVKLFIAYWEPQNPNCTEIKIKKIDAVYDECKHRYSWEQELFPEIYPTYNEVNFGKEERAYRKKSLHYMVNSSRVNLTAALCSVIDRYTDAYEAKLKRWKYMNITKE